MKFPKLDHEFVRQRLEIPENGKVKALLDTDTYNEVDDQFALTYALLRSDRMELEAVLAAPFLNERSSSPEDGMERSYNEIKILLNRMGMSSEGRVFKGSRGYLPNRETPVESPAAEKIVERALAAKRRGDVLYVMAIGAITNVASALLLCPEIIESIVIIWLGGNPQHCEQNDEFNLKQDVPAAQVVFSCGAPVIQIPCQNVAELLNLSLPELERYVKGRGAIGDYLFETVQEQCKGLSRVIWDISAPAVLTIPGALPSSIIPAPTLNDDKSWTMNKTGHPFKVVRRISRDWVFGDFFKALDKFAKGK